MCVVFVNDTIQEAKNEKRGGGVSGYLASLLPLTHNITRHPLLSCLLPHLLSHFIKPHLIALVLISSLHNPNTTLQSLPIPGADDADARGVGGRRYDLAVGAREPNM